MDEPDKDLEEQKEQEDELQHRLLLEDRERKFKPVSHFSYYAYSILVLILVTLFVIGLIPKLSLEKKINELAKATSEPKVLILEAKGIDTPVELTLPSSLDAINITPIWARVDGYIRTFLSDIGDIVKEGDVLAEIETPELDQAYEQAIADLGNAKARYDIAKITSDRWSNLYREDSESISKQEVDQKNADLDAAEAEVNSSQANVKRLKETLEFKHIIAPFDGIIIERDIDIGSLITAGSANYHQQLFKIAKTNIMRVFVNVPQRFFRSIKKDVEADVYISEFPENPFKGIVARYARALDPVARTLLTEVHISNPDYELLVGLYADVKFMLKPDYPYFLLPTSAVIIRAEGPKVAVLDKDDVIHIKKVTLGLDHGKWMEIISGISENERIITNPSDKVVEGRKAEVIAHKK
jgi:RND family efflux transporter MFP subunit